MMRVFIYGIILGLAIAIGVETFAKRPEMTVLVEEPSANSPAPGTVDLQDLGLKVIRLETVICGKLLIFVVDTKVVKPAEFEKFVGETVEQVCDEAGQ